MPEPLPPFPVDPGTLNVLADTIRDAEGDHLDRLLTLMAGHDPAGEETVHDGARIVDTGPLYSREDVILALITEVRQLRARPEYAPDGRRVIRLHRAYPDGRHTDDCPGCAP